MSVLQYLFFPLIFFRGSFTVIKWLKVQILWQSSYMKDNINYWVRKLCARFWSSEVMQSPKYCKITWQQTTENCSKIKTTMHSVSRCIPWWGWLIHTIFIFFTARYPVVSPTSRFANDSFANVLGRFANVPSRFANVLLVNSPTSKSKFTFNCMSCHLFHSL